jgi:hypothetical protein
MALGYTRQRIDLLTKSGFGPAPAQSLPERHPDERASRPTTGTSWHPSRGESDERIPIG